MDKEFLIKKASGETEPFSIEKFKNSLRRVGADNETIDQIVNDIQGGIKDVATTRSLYKQAFRLLKRYKKGSAARYRLKKAIMELGPTGYPFEHFVGQLIKHYGFEVEIGKIVLGQCVQHEVDVIATGNNKQIFVECKFYNSQGKNASVKVPLYIHSRVNDIVKKRQALPEFSKLNFQGWIVTNTRFTTDAIDYGKCAGLHLVGWDYPRGHSLREMIEKAGFIPVTALTSINKMQKKILLDEGVVICRQICQNKDLLKKLNLTGKKYNTVLNEINGVCNCNDLNS